MDKKIFEALKKIFPKSKLPKNISKLKIGDIKGGIRLEILIYFSK